MAKQKSSSTKKILTICGIILVVLIVFGLGARSLGWLGDNEGVTVETSKAEMRTITQTVSASGKIQPEVEVVIRPEVSGEIIELPIKEGDFVEKGDLLVRIKPDIYESRIDEMNASLLTQKARKEQARASYLEAKSAFEKNKKLYDREAISESEFSQSKHEYESQKANFEAAKYQVQSVEAQLEQAKGELQKTIIRAPQQGTVSKLDVEVGERVLGSNMAQGTEMLRIAKMGQMEVKVQVNENDIVNVAVGDSANIMADAYPEQSFQGIVTEIANSADISGEGTSEEVTNYEVKVRITTPHNLDFAVNKKPAETASQKEQPQKYGPSFKPGMSATVDVETQTVQNVVSIPIQAVTVRDFSKDKNKTESDSSNSANTETKEDSAKTDKDSDIEPYEDLRKVVFVVDNGKVHRREVNTGISDNRYMQLLSGVEEGEEVVIGSYRVLSKELSDSDKVNVNNQQFSR